MPSNNNPLYKDLLKGRSTLINSQDKHHNHDFSHDSLGNILENSLRNPLENQDHHSTHINEQIVSKTDIPDTSDGHAILVKPSLVKTSLEKQSQESSQESLPSNTPQSLQKNEYEKKNLSLDQENLSLGQEQWSRIQSRVHHEIGDEYYHRYIRPLVFYKQNNSKIYFTVRHVHKNNQEKQDVIVLPIPMYNRILSLWQAEDSSISEIVFDNNKMSVVAVDPSHQTELHGHTHGVSSHGVLGHVAQSLPLTPINYLHKDYIFSSFCVDDSNRQAYNVCLNMAHQQGVSLSPVIIEGSVGLGKTHLLQAIAHELQKKKTTKIYYKSSEQFLISFLESLKKGKINDWRQHYLDLDYLLLDDLQFLSRKQSTLNELSFIINELEMKGASIGIAASMPLESLGLPPRLLSRLQAGVAVELSYPSPQLRYGVLQAKNKKLGMNVKDSILKTLSHKLTGSIRECEGSLKRLYVQGLVQKDQTPLSIQQALSHQGFSKSSLSQAQIVTLCSKYYGFETSDILGKRRTKKLALCRQITVYIMRQVTMNSLMEIAKYFGKHHTTVMHAIENIEKEINHCQNVAVRQDIERIKTMIHEVSYETIH